MTTVPSPASVVALPSTSERGHRYFNTLTRRLFGESSELSVLLVTHILADRPPFVAGLSKGAKIRAIFPKPKSVNPEARAALERDYTFFDITRSALANANDVLTMIEPLVGSDEFAILDIGGYFAPVAKDIHERYKETFLGIVEDTENGQQQYEKHDVPKTVPVYSVARSPLKEPEDYLVGDSVVFSAERLIRSCGEVLFGRRAIVFGYGKIGRSAARSLSVRGVRVSVVDTDPVRSVEAQAHGFRSLDKRTALATGDIILGATGQFSLEQHDFRHVRNGAFIASVTSSESELDMQHLPSQYNISPVTEGVECYSRLGHYFYLLNEGNAVNFLDGAVVGPYIYLVQGEILAALNELRRKNGNPGSVLSVSEEVRKDIASVWSQVFNDNTIIIPGTL